MTTDRKQKMDRAAAERCVRRQVAAISKLKGLDVQTAAARATTFLQGEVAFVRETLCVGDTAARWYLAMRSMDVEILLAEFSAEALAQFERAGIEAAATCIASDEAGEFAREKVCQTIRVEVPSWA